MLCLQQDNLCPTQMDLMTAVAVEFVTLSLVALAYEALVMLTEIVCMLAK